MFSEFDGHAYPETVTVKECRVLKNKYSITNLWHERQTLVETEEGYNWIDVYIGENPDKYNYTPSVGEVLHKHVKGSGRFIWYKKEKKNE